MVIIFHLLILRKHLPALRHPLIISPPPTRLPVSSQKPPKIRLSVVNTLCLLKKRTKSVHFCAEPVHFCSKPAQNQRISAHFCIIAFSPLTSFHTSTYKNFPPECQKPTVQKAPSAGRNWTIITPQPKPDWAKPNREGNETRLSRMDRTG
jgi:hypothetical protein